MEAVWAHPHPVASVQLVLVALAWRTLPGNGEAAVSERALEAMTGISRRSVGRALSRAVADGYLEISWWRQGRPTRYRINLGEHRISGSLRTSSGIGAPHQPRLPGVVDNSEAVSTGCSTGGAPSAPQVAHLESDYQGKRDADAGKRKREKEMV